MYDVVIIGGGVAGLTAAIYTTRKQLKTLIISLDVGGQTLMAKVVHNYPGFKQVSGVELINKFYDHAISLGAEIIIGEVKKVRKEGERFVVVTNSGEIICRTVLVASGLVPKKLGVSGEDRLIGKGVSYCVTCDAPLYKGRVVGFTGARVYENHVLELSKICERVYYFGRTKNELPDNVEVRSDKVLRFEGSEKLEKVVTNKGELNVDGFFVYKGYNVNTEPFKELVDLDEDGRVIVNERNETRTPGLFAAGDVTNIPYKQIIISAGEGAKAALQLYHWLTGKKMIDW